MDNKCQNWTKVANLDLSDLDINDLWSDSIKSRFGQLISTISGKVHAKIEKMLLTSFWENALKCKKGTILTFWPLKNNLYSDSTKSFLWYVVNVIPKKLHAKKEKKLLKRFWLALPPPPLKVDADDDDDDDGQVGIWKAPLPDGTAKLKRDIVIVKSFSSSISPSNCMLLELTLQLKRSLKTTTWEQTNSLSRCAILCVFYSRIMSLWMKIVHKNYISKQWFSYITCVFDQKTILNWFTRW